MAFDINNIRIGVIGLGYVGLPLAVEFGRKHPTVGFDVKESRVAELQSGTDSTLEASDEELASAGLLNITTNAEDLSDCNFYVVTVPTPVGEGNRPLLTPLRAASETIANMSLYVVSRIIKKMLAKGMQPMDARVLVLGLAFKENCPDVRNTKVIDIVRELGSYGAIVDVYDPWVDSEDAEAEYGIELRKQPAEEAYDVVVVAVGYQQFKDLGAEGIRRYCKRRSVIYDIKYLLPSDSTDDRL
jgi:UDP-N-acetyl-D-mannosaminuronate dehydrogenase